MFDPYKALKPLDGKAYDNLRDLFRALGQVRWEHLTELPVSYGVRELMDLARERNWLVEDERGTLRFQFQTPAPSRGGTLAVRSRTAGKVSKPRGPRAPSEKTR